MKAQLLQVKTDFESDLENTENLQLLNEIRVKYLGKKGVITSVLKSLGSLSVEERKEVGLIANQIKDFIEESLKVKEEKLKAKELEEKLKREYLDVTLPHSWHSIGYSHPVIATLNEITSIFVSMGFSVESGPEVESEDYNFTMLNIPPHHPARDMQDTFYLNNGMVLRTHTSPVQIRTMLKKKPPIAMVAPGRVYRKDLDPTHSPMFHQIEGLVVDRDVTFRDLKGVLKIFLETIFGKDIPIRFRPSYFPFTEPSAEVDIGCTVCKGVGCKVCKETGWLEILGCGMVDPEVFKAVNIDPQEYSGFAFGLGIERIAMLRYQITDIRLLFNNDMRFLSQFEGIG
ncbi:MAG: phenylalanine--tRNA ligase subunit alpha [Hydrogenothermaceae bacterium]|nr:phenylalanine--tRNA ligase subunit alpha [Hydrogenothermaceae bacterium]